MPSPRTQPQALTRPEPAVPSGLRTRARRAMRAEVAAVATELFLANGFDNTTIEQIAAAAGMSRSSFFRYFPTKEDVVLGELDDYGQQILDALVGRPDNEPLWAALRRALEPVLPSDDDVQARQLSRMLLQTPSLKARHYEKTLAWQAVLVPEVARRLGLPSASYLKDPRPVALISCALACRDAAIDSWTNGDDTASLTELLDTAMTSVGRQATVST